MEWRSDAETVNRFMTRGTSKQHGNYREREGGNTQRERERAEGGRRLGGIVNSLISAHFRKKPE